MKLFLFIKRTFDILGSLILILLTSPIMIITCILLKLESSGPIIFKQERPGKDAKIFTIYKFRTMKVQTESEGRKLTDIERISKIGNFLRKASIDELPQLFNILKGDMSFIGPRPLLVQYLEFYNTEQMRRHDVRPGISGWAQVNGRNTISWEKKFEYDVWYVDHMNMLLDIKIAIMTLNKVLGRKDINTSETVTMSPFTGTKPKI